MRLTDKNDGPEWLAYGKERMDYGTEELFAFELFKERNVLRYRIKALECLVQGIDWEEWFDASEILVSQEAWKRTTDHYREALLHTAAHLAAAIWLLENGGKRAAPSDKMFSMMLADYRKALKSARDTLNVSNS